MKYETIIYKLKLKGYNLQMIADELKTSRQNVRASLISGKAKRGKAKKILERVGSIIFL